MHLSRSTWRRQLVIALTSTGFVLLYSSVRRHAQA